MELHKILYIDDELRNTQAFTASFRRDFNIFTADSVSGAKEIIALHDDISVIISDQRMPSQTGVNYFKELKDTHPLIIRILLTAYMEHEVVAESINSGEIYRYANKPWDYQNLKQIIHEAIQFHTLKKENQLLLLQYKELFDNNPLPIVLLDTQGEKIVAVNKTFIDFSELEDGAIDLSFHSFFQNLPVDFVHHHCPHVAYLNFETAKNTIKKIRLNIRKITLNSSTNYLVSLEDLTERIKFEKNKMNLISQVQDEEREYLTMELHDGLAQELVLLKLMIEKAIGNEFESPKFDGVREIMKSITNHLRDVTYKLSPPDLMNNSLTNSLTYLFNKINSVNIISFSIQYNNCEKQIDSLDKERAYNLYRIFQEFVSNSIKHSKCSEVEASFSLEKNELLVTLKDNGIGLKLDALTNGKGLQNMEKRSKIHNFNSRIVSTINEGVTLTLQIPLKLKH